uniref:Nucleoside diphosphate kinase-like domain-containing protein n=1 Tax=Arcella intermedia TaxID=1963864 RepID=A0A6B2LTS8_9EUKA
MFCRGDGAKQAIITKMRDHGLSVVATRRVERWHIEEARRFYGEHKGRFYFPRLIHHMTSAPFEVYVLQGEDAIAKWRRLMVWCSLGYVRLGV